MIKRAAVFVDLANIGSAFQKLLREKNLSASPQMRLDIVKLVQLITIGMEVIFKGVYVGMPSGSAQLSFKKRLEYDGFVVVTKEPKVIQTVNGSVTKNNFDCEITYDIASQIWRNGCEEIILCSGDSDFAFLPAKIRESGKEFTVVSSKGSISRELFNETGRRVFIEDLPIEGITFVGKKSADDTDNIISKLIDPNCQWK
jgi:uncharacterized LabA/DUF88 family protein